MRTPPRPVCAGLVLLLVTTPWSPAAAQSPPPSLDDQLRVQLALGQADGCVALFQVQPGVDGIQAAVDQRLTELRNQNQIGNELRAICGPSAVNSASSLGGALNTLQATKTVTQFRLVRRRIDQRLDQQRGTPPPVRPPEPARNSLAARLQQPAPVTITTGRDLATGAGIFGEIELGTRDRATTGYESGFTSDVRNVAVGVDYAGRMSVAGGWIGRARQEASFAAATAILPPASLVGQDVLSLLQQPGVLSDVCGGWAASADSRSGEAASST